LQKEGIGLEARGKMGGGKKGQGLQIKMGEDGSTKKSTESRARRQNGTSHRFSLKERGDLIGAKKE